MMAIIKDARILGLEGRERPGDAGEGRTFKDGRGLGPIVCYAEGNNWDKVANLGRRKGITDTKMSR